MNRKFLSILSGIVILLITYFISNLIINKETESYNNNTNITHSVRTIEIENSSNPISVKVNGRLSAKYKVDLFSEVQGTINNINKDLKVGQSYIKGEAIIKINSKEFLATVKQNRSQLQNMVASVLPDIKLDFKNNYENWELYFKSFDIKKNTKTIPKPLSDKEKFYLVGKGLMAQYFKIKNLEERLSKYTISAPYDGTLIEAYSSEGSLILSGQRLGTYINTNVFELEVAVPSKYGNQLETGKEVLFTSTFNTKHTGKIIRVNKSIDKNSQSIRLFVEFKSKNLKDGMYSEVNIPLGNIEDSFSLSRSLLINDSFIYYIKDNMTIGIFNVNPIFYDDENVIVKGLENGMNILKTYIPGVYDGMKVKIVN
tara:strand:+ start:10753 stop:11862 length:1110 start_codon:yes stop_codon:yes gene_type:complete